MSKPAPTTAQEAAPAACRPAGGRGQYFGESKGNEGYIIDRGTQYIMRSGWEPAAVPIGSLHSDHGESNLLEGVGSDLVRRTVTGGYYSVAPDQLRGRSVALLFSSGDHSKCTSFIPFLIQFYKSVNEAGSAPKVEVIYVGLDRDEGSFERSRKSMPWLSLQYNSRVRTRLINRYRFKVDQPAPIVRPTVALGLPRLLVVGPRGEAMHWLPCDHESAVVLREWDFTSCQWPLVPSQRPLNLWDDQHAAAAAGGKDACFEGNKEQGENISYEWPLNPKDAAAWPMHRQRHEGDLERQKPPATCES